MELTNLTGLLQSWEVPQDVIKNFIDNGITIDTLKELNSVYLKELCPHIGHIIKLSNHVQDLLDSVAETETATSEPSTSQDIIHLERVETLTEQSLAFNNSTPVPLDDENSLLPELDISNYFNEHFQRLPLPEFDIKTLLQTSAHGCSVLNYYNQYKNLNSKKRNILVDILVKHIYTYIINK